MNEIQIKNLDLNLLEVFRVLVEEGSVNRASERLGQTPSAISHALGRLREQIDDPLLVRVSGRMQPSSRGTMLYDDIRPVLAQIERAVQPPVAFQPETTTRGFRISAPATSIVTALTVDLAAQAPGIHIEWTPPEQTTFEQIMNEEVDLACGIANTPLLENLGSQSFEAQQRYV